MQAATIGADPKDKVAADAWYRGQLAEVVGLTTTAGASDETMELLCKHFEAMTGTEAGLAPTAPLLCKSFSASQNAACMSLAKKAHAATRARNPKAAAFELWLPARIAEALHEQGNRFDLIMGYLAAIAGDEYWIDHCARASEIRMRYQVARKLAELSRLSRRELGWAYVQGCLDQARLGTSIEDCPAEHLRAVLAMLSIAVKRVLKEGAEASRAGKA
jgi:prophage antirepressor-like protein